jgi:hypothetical protein
MNELLRWLGEDAGAGEEGHFAELCKAVSVRKNKEHARRFAAVPYRERIVLVPQCLRKLGTCEAVETARGYDCKQCDACPAGPVFRKAAELGYRGVYMLKGGRAVAALLAEQKPGAVVGVACDYEGALGMLECERAGVPVQFIPLLRDGCSETDVDVSDVVSVLEFYEKASAGE